MEMRYSHVWNAYYHWHTTPVGLPVICLPDHQAPKVNTYSKQEEAIINLKVKWERVGVHTVDDECIMTCGVDILRDEEECHPVAVKHEFDPAKAMRFGGVILREEEALFHPIPKYAIGEGMRVILYIGLSIITALSIIGICAL